MYAHLQACASLKSKKESFIFMNESTVSLYSIVDEIKQAEGKSLKSDQLSKETSKYSKNLKEILTGLSIDPDLFKDNDGKYEIPAQAKDEVIKMLNLYTSKEMKLVRKSQFDDLEYKDLKEIIESVKLLLSCKLSGKTLLIHLNQLEVLTQFSLKKAIDEFQEEGIQALIKESRQILDRSFEMILNQADRAALMKYYNQLIIQLHEDWEQIIEIVNDIREAEVGEVTDEDMDTYENAQRDAKFPIHKAVLKDILGMKEEIQKKHLEELKKQINLETNAEILKELQLLAKKNVTDHFKLVTDEDYDVSKVYQSTDDLIKEAVTIHLENKKQKPSETYPNLELVEQILKSR